MHHAQKRNVRLCAGADNYNDENTSGFLKYDTWAVMSAKYWNAFGEDAFIWKSTCCSRGMPTQSRRVYRATLEH